MKPQILIRFATNITKFCTLLIFRNKTKSCFTFFLLFEYDSNGNDGLFSLDYEIIFQLITQLTDFQSNPILQTRRKNRMKSIVVGGVTGWHIARKDQGTLWNDPSALVDC